MPTEREREQGESLGEETPGLIRILFATGGRGEVIWRFFSCEQLEEEEKGKEGKEEAEEEEEKEEVEEQREENGRN